MRLFLILTFFLMGSSLASAQEKRLGTVFSESTREPLSGATIRLHSTGVISQADAQGNFNIPIAKEIDTLSLSFIGYVPYQLVLTVLS